MTTAAPAPRRLVFSLPEPVAEIMERVEMIETFLAEAGCDPGAAQQVAIVAEEILTNVARNAWPGERGLCCVEVTAAHQSADVSVVMTVRDDGVPFDPLAAAAPDLDSPLEQREIGGLGIHLMRTLTDWQRYERRDGWNILTIRKDCPAVTGDPRHGQA